MTGETIGYSPSTPALSLTTKPKPFRPGPLENPSQTGPQPARNPIETTQYRKREASRSYPFGCFTWRLYVLCFALWRWENQVRTEAREPEPGTGTHAEDVYQVKHTNSVRAEHTNSGKPDRSKGNHTNLDQTRRPISRKISGPKTGKGAWKGQD